MGGLSSYFFPPSSYSSSNLTRTTTITSESSTRSSSSSHLGTSSARSSTSTLLTSSSFSNLLDAAKDYVFGEPAVFYPPSNQGKSLREAKEDLGELEAGGGWSSEGGGGGILARRLSVGLRTTPSRSRASSTASSSSSIAGIVASNFTRAQAAAGFSSSDSADETDTIRERVRRKSISSNPPKVSFTDTVRTHRRSRSATPSDRGRIPPSASCPTGFKLLSPLPELPRSSNHSINSTTSSSSPTSTIHSFGGGPSTPTRRRPRSPSMKSSGTLTEGGETDEEEEQEGAGGGGRTPFEGRGSLKFTFGGKANQSDLSLASSSRSEGGRLSSPTKRSLQGRRMVGTRSYTGGTPTSIGASSSTDVSRTSTPIQPSPPTLVIDLVVPETSPVPPKLELPPLPRSTTMSTLRPRSRHRTYSLPFAPHLELPSASSLASSSSTGNSSGSSIASGSTSSRSPFFDPTLSLKADQPATTLNTVAQPASLSDFSSWAFPEEGKDGSTGEDQPQAKHRVLAPLRSYDLTPAGPSSSLPSSSSMISVHPFPTLPLSSSESGSGSSSYSQHVRTPSSSPSLGFNSPNRRPINVDRALSQPLLNHSSRSLSKSLSSSASSASSSGSSPPTMGPPPVPHKPGGGLRRATTISNPRPPSSAHSHTAYHVRTNSRSTSPAMTNSPPMMGRSSSTFAFPSSSSSSSFSNINSNARPQPKLRLPQSYSLQGVKDHSSFSDYPPLPYSSSSSRSYAPSSPSGSSDAGSVSGGGGDLSWIPPLAGRRGSHSSQSSLRMEVHPFEDRSDYQQQHYQPQHQHPMALSSSSTSSSSRGAGGGGSVGRAESTAAALVGGGGGRPGLWRSASSAVSLSNLLSGGVGLGRKSSLRESTTERERKVEEERERERVRKEEEEEEEEYITFRKGL